MLEKIKTGLRKFMTGRYGFDKLNYTLLISGLILGMVTSFTGNFVCMVIYTLLYILCIFRTFSRNTAKRAEENRKFLQACYTVKSETQQFFKRLKYMKDYKYFRCPQCKTRMRMPRKSGEHTIQCKKCMHQFKMKA